jgi:hypothetical protein
MKINKIPLIIHVNTKLVGSQQDLAKINPYALGAILNSKKFIPLLTSHSDNLITSEGPKIF